MRQNSNNVKMFVAMENYSKASQTGKKLAAKSKSLRQLSYIQGMFLK